MATTAQFARFQELVADRTNARTNHELLFAYYGLIGDIMEQGWGASHHFAPFRGDESLAEAIKTFDCRFAERAGLTAGKSALEIGSGIGGPALVIAEYSGAHVTGLELNRERIERARVRADESGLSDQVGFTQGDAQEIPFPDNSFDVVYSFECICHIPDKRRVFAEMARVLKPGGVTFGTDWCVRDGLGAEEIRHYIDPICHYHSMPHLSTPVEIRQWLQSAGLRDVKVFDRPREGSFDRVWAMLADAAKPAMESGDPVLGFMGAGARSLSEAGPIGAFFIGEWEARKPDSPSN